MQNKYGKYLICLSWLWSDHTHSTPTSTRLCPIMLTLKLCPSLGHGKERLVKYTKCTLGQDFLKDGCKELFGFQAAGMVTLSVMVYSCPGNKKIQTLFDLTFWPFDLTAWPLSLQGDFLLISHSYCVIRAYLGCLFGDSVITRLGAMCVLSVAHIIKHRRNMVHMF